MVSFLASNRVLVGAVAAGLGAIAVGVLGITAGWWPLIVVGTGAIGYLVTPPSKQQQFVSGREDRVEDVVKKAQSLAQLANRQLSEDARKSVADIARIIEQVAPDLESGGKASDQFIAVEAVINDYLPDTIERFLEIPPAYRNTKNHQGKTPSFMLEAQLGGLQAKLRELEHSVVQGHVRELEEHGAFLQAAYLKPVEFDTAGAISEEIEDELRSAISKPQPPEPPLPRSRLEPPLSP